MSQTRDQQRFTISEVAADWQWCRSALCGYPLPALMDNWTHGAASRHTVAPIRHTRPSPCSSSYYSYIPHSTEGRRLSLPKHTVGLQLAEGRLQWTGCESNLQPLGYESDTLPLHHCTHTSTFGILLVPKM